MKIAAIISDDFEDREYTVPEESFVGAGHEVVTVGLRAGVPVKGKREGTAVWVDRPVREVSSDDFDALLIPGGYSPDKLRTDEDAVSFVRDFTESGKPVFVICHGPQLMISAGVLRGRRITGYKSLIKDIENAGAEFIDAEVVEDGNIISSRKPADLSAFVKAALRRMEPVSVG